MILNEWITADHVSGDNGASGNVKRPLGAAGYLESAWNCPLVEEQHIGGAILWFDEAAQQDVGLSPLGQRQGVLVLEQSEAPRHADNCRISLPNFTLDGLRYGDVVVSCY